MRRPSSRSRHGNVLALILALVLGIGLVILIFGLKYTRFLGTNLEQRTAIEAAALAAAKDMSRIVIEDPYFGFVSLSDYAPVGKNTIAGDNFYLPVQGINTLLATVRLDLIVSDYMQDPLMKQCATSDYNRAIAVKDKLVSTLNAAVQGGAGVDIDGNSFNPVNDAITAYETNIVRMTGQPSHLIPGSLKLTLGYVDKLGTNTVVPQPQSVGQVAQSQQQNGFYKPNVSFPYSGMDFVFAAVGDDTTLVDHKVFQTAPPTGGLPFSIPTVVKCEADQLFSDRDQQGNPITRTVHGAAAAEPASCRDQRPAPGAFTITFTAQVPPNIKQPGNIITDQGVSQTPCDKLQTPLSGDYPQTQLSDFSMPELVPPADRQHPLMGQVFSVAFYDWIRRGGTKVNVQSVVDTMESAFSGTGPAIHQYEPMPDGTIKYTVLPVTQANLSVSNKQWRAISGLGYGYDTSAASAATPIPAQRLYDLQLTDYVYQPGRVQGGLHAGEPMDFEATTVANGLPTANNPAFYENATLPYYAFLTGPGGGAVRPTYQKTGVAIDFTFRLRP